MRKSLRLRSLPPLQTRFPLAKLMQRGLQVFLVFGKSGWIGGLIGQLLKERGLKFEYANARLEDRAEVIADIERVRSHAASASRWQAKTHYIHIFEAVSN